MPLKIRRQNQATLGQVAILLYGEPKVGKTTAAAQFPKPLILNCEKGTTFLTDVDIVDVESVSALLDVAKQIAALEENDYKTIVIDGITGLVRSELMKKKKRQQAEDKRTDPRSVFQEISELIMQAMDILHGIGKIIVATGTSRKILADEQPKSRYEPKNQIVVPDFNPALVDDILALFDVIAFCYLSRSGRQMVTKPIIRGSITVRAGDRSGKLPERMPLDANELMTRLREAAK